MSKPETEVETSRQRPPL